MGSGRSIEPTRRRRRALVTRPRDEAAGVAAALALRGIDALVEPLLEIDYRNDIALDLAGVQAIMCTSANGVRALARLSDERAVRLFVVGDASAAAARAAGFADVVSAGGAVGDLAALVRRRLDPVRGRLLHVVGAAVAGDLAGLLRQGGFSVERAVLYEARPAVALSPACVDALGAGDIGLALFFSPRTAAIFAGLAEAAGVAATLRTVAAISISAATDTALGALQFTARHVAKRPSQSNLLTLLDDLIAARQPA